MNRAWLLAAADRLDAQGDHDLAREARAEAEIEASMILRRPVVHHCDMCGRSITSRSRIDKYADTLGVDWVLCRTCEQATKGEPK